MNIFNNNGKEARASFFVLSEKLVKMATYLTSSVLIARMAGPEVFGQYSSLLAVAVIFTAVSAMGLNALLVKEFIQAPTVGRVLSNVMILRLQAACLAAVIMAAVIVFVLGFGFLPGIITALLLPIAVFQIADSLFESRLEMARVLQYKTLAYVSGLGIKVTTAIVSPELLPLLMAHIAEMLLILIGAAFSMFRVGIFPSVSATDREYRWALFRKGFPLLLSSGAVLLYMKIDLPMILALSGSSEAGVYSVATRLCEALFIISIPIIVAVFPKLQSLYSENETLFYRYTRKVFALLFASGCVTYTLAAIFAEPVVSTLFGPEYTASADIIRVFALSLPIIFVGDLLSRWLIITDNLTLSLYRHLAGLAVNVSLNYLLIPLYGGMGAACASVAGYTSAVIIFPILNARARKFFNFMRLQ